MADLTEYEFKLRARGHLEVAAIDATLRDLSVVCKHAESRRHSDTYLDDKAGSLLRGGVGLRLRQSHEGRTLTCKTRGEIKGGMHIRREVEAAWEMEELPRLAEDLPDEIREAVEPFILGRALRPLHRLVVTREARTLADGGKDLCELAIDSVEAHANSRVAKFQEIELEVIHDAKTCERIAHDLRARLPVDFVTDNKPTYAASLLGLEQQSMSGRLKKRRERGRELAGAAIPRQLLRRLKQMRGYEAKVRSGDDPEDLRKMRIAIRRARSLASAAHELWPKEAAENILTELTDAGRRLGEVRDLDATLTQMQSSPTALPQELREGVERAAQWVRRQRANAHERVQVWLRSDERQNAGDQLEQNVTRLDDRSPIAAEAMKRVAPKLLATEIAALRAQVSSISEDLPTESMHRLRRAAKRARYLAEEFVDLPGMSYRKSLHALVRVQRRLGTVCDHELASHRLAGWVRAAAADNADGASVAAALGGLSTAHAAAAAAAREQAREALGCLNRKRTWKHFPRA